MGRGKEIILDLTFEWGTLKCNNVLYNKIGKATTTQGNISGSFNKISIKTWPLNQACKRKEEKKIMGVSNIQLFWAQLLLVGLFEH